MSLKEKLDALRIEAETKLLPTHIVEILHKATDELKASGAELKALKVGDKAPVFELKDPDGKMVSSVTLLEKGPLIVSFYRGVWCPYCNLDLKALEETRTEFEATGASLIAISQQTAVNSRRSQRDNQLGFPILSDHEGKVAEAFGVRWALPDYLIKAHRDLGVDLETFNGETSWTLPMPSRFVIGQDGSIIYAEVDADYTKRPEPEDILPLLKMI